MDDVSTGQARLDRPDAIRRRLAGTGDAQLVLCAYTHIPRVVISGGFEKLSGYEALCVIPSFILR
ncbi:hypothetical protein JK222_15555 [Gluconobacter cerinus]|uniref:hypothetical protein n=1 Tax=Gluconobacter cerinus TaxID=38307 RepID=UPI001B8D374B|nr:hypothetical protein [Gluconobacter cerinus]MBS1073090.1 hypothetical protein [Gluconobacter cerinus]